MPRQYQERHSFFLWPSLNQQPVKKEKTRNKRKKRRKTSNESRRRNR